MKMPTPSRCAPVLAPLWAIGVLVGFGMLWSYSNRPGVTHAAPQQWPADSTLVSSERMTLLMAVHPHCPCTRSSLSELARIMRFNEGQVDCAVLIYLPTDADQGWSDTGIHQSALDIVGVQTYIDHDGQEARRHGIATSGAVVLYDAQGNRCFSGGITPARGHEGDCAGIDAVLALMRGQTPATECTAVFGCSLDTPNP